ncbi:hypothetical protein SDC9_189554 [bioreactor metagenome]|uniref:Uncharacterized protein n=1 Tax=bioreactor metagenome TaxID=1076179 RepID=A0A645HSH3_9ZZZZ
MIFQRGTKRTFKAKTLMAGKNRNADINVLYDLFLPASGGHGGGAPCTEICSVSRRVRRSRQ